VLARDTVLSDIRYYSNGYIAFLLNNPTNLSITACGYKVSLPSAVRHAVVINDISGSTTMCRNMQDSTV